jgi:hypothetical protein
MILVAGLASTLAIGAFAQQHEQTPPNQPDPGMMGGGMMMGRMMAHHREMSALMTEAMQNMTAIQNEKDPAALKAEIAEQQALLTQLHEQMTMQGGMMQNMMQKMPGRAQRNCPMAGDTPPPGDKTPAK